MKTLLSLLLILSALSTKAQLNYASVTIPSVSVSFHLNKDNWAKSYAILNNTKDLPVVLSFVEWKDISDNHFLVIRASNSVNPKDILYCAFSKNFGVVNIYDANMKHLFSFPNDSKIKDMVVANRISVSFNDFF